MRSLLALYFTVVVWLVLGLPEAVQANPASLEAGFPAQPQLADYLQWATAHSPALGSARHQVEALRQDAAGAGSLPDLKFMWGEMIVPVETRVGPQQRVFSLSQSIPWFGTLGLKRQSTLAGAAAAEAQLQGMILDLHRNIRDVWYQLALVQKEEEILSQHLDLASQAEHTIRTSYEAGREKYGSLIKAQMELGRIQTQLDNVRDRTGPLTARLNNLAAVESWQASPTADLSPPFMAAEIMDDSSALKEILAERNPGLRAERDLLSAARSQRELAGKEGGPDLTVGVDYIMTGEAANPATTGSGKDPVIARLGVSIPLWGGRTAAGKASTAELVQAADSRLTSLQLELETRLEETLYRVRVADRNLRLYGETLHQRAVQDLEVTLVAYQSGQMDFQDLLTARQSLLGIELARVQAQSDHSRALNELQTLLGGGPETGMPGATDSDPKVK